MCRRSFESCLMGGLGPGLWTVAGHSRVNDGQQVYTTRVEDEDEGETNKASRAPDCTGWRSRWAIASAFGTRRERVWGRRQDREDVQAELPDLWAG